ncbi:Eco57I restriction-modification methylase domain-containing protein [Kordia sp.]|uniref:Eco57I restriction-modification methylase domain-containing protein n=1 Tax=Kordia sp. TaxID=1965332 RepID=UPI003D2D46EA
MALYQKSVVNTYLKQQNFTQLQKAYKKYAKYFLSPAIQENIRHTKEEQYQGLFLTELFVNVLNYTLKPNKDFNLVAEYKNQNNARKADGAILKEDNAIGVIELKGTKTKDLESIRRQAFDYKANQKGCVYVITSNFEKLRFYINDATEFEEFNLFKLTEERFALLYLCLHKDNILLNVPLKIKEASIQEEEQITKDFYKDYSLFKRELYRDLVKRNGKRLKNISYEEFTANTNATEEETAAEYLRLEKNVKLTLFKKSQKLIDRFLFIFFAEDRDLLPPNLTMKILEDWNRLKELDEVVPLYKRFKLYFKYLDEGRKGTDKKAEIYAYNGGLFKQDTILDSLEIDDNLLHTYTYKLARYDFDSQVDVNILGHIFENSLNEIESINAEIEGADFDKQKSKRKKDGVFYTPKYITKYIVENTIGKLCEEKKAELHLKEEEYYKGRKNRNKTTIQKLVAILDAYREWLLQLTICDPACGSGAFLNQALDFLIAEHNYINELKAKILGGTIVFSDIENTVLENNIYGVDLNEESVEIAKLSLWLRTAQPRRKLNDLSSNIKCGNSLIDSKTVAGSKAFHWETEFPQVFREKNKKAYHITTAIHDSRTSARMVKYKVRERRDLGTNPYPNVIYFTPEDDLLISQTIATIVAEDKLNLLAYNICADHIHLLLVCELEAIPAIMQKIKSITAKHVNNTRYDADITREHVDITREHAPLRNRNEDADSITREHAPLRNLHAPLRKKKRKPLWQQKYSAPKEITTEEQLHNTLKYIQTNRSKHELPKHSKAVQKTITEMCCSVSDAFTTEYTGGFDVVIGNPPYVRQELFKEVKPYLEKNYKCYNSIADLYTYFIEKGINLMNEKGLFSFILPNKFLKATYGKNIRKVIKEEANLELLFDFDDYPVFADATTYPIIYILNKKKNNINNTFLYSEINKRENTVDPIALLELKKQEVSFSSLTDKEWSFSNINVSALFNKIKSKSVPLKEVVSDKIFRGVSTGCNDVFIVSEEIKNQITSSSVLRKIFTGKEVKRYRAEFQSLYLLFIDWDYDLDTNDELKEYLLSHKIKLEKRPEVKQGRFNWWCLSRYGSKNSHLLSEPKIIYPRINNKCNFFLDETGEFSLSDNNFFISSGSKSLLAFLNSSLTFFFLKNNCTTLQGGYLDFRRPSVEKIPIHKHLMKIEKELIVFSDEQLKNNNEYSILNIKFQTYLKHKFQLEKLSKKLQNWHQLSFGDFIKELNKAIKSTNKLRAKEEKELIAVLTKSDEFEWLTLFETKQKEAQELQTLINATDKQIDQMVYKLYELTEEEIAIVEAS